MIKEFVLSACISARDLTPENYFRRWNQIHFTTFGTRYTGDCIGRYYCRGSSEIDFQHRVHFVTVFHVLQGIAFDINLGAFRIPAPPELKKLLLTTFRPRFSMMPSLNTNHDDNQLLDLKFGLPMQSQLQILTVRFVSRDAETI